METEGYKRVGLGLSLAWLFFCLFPLYFVAVTAFKPPLAVSQGPTYFPFVDFQPTLQAFRDALSGLRGDFYGPIVSSIRDPVSSRPCRSWMAATVSGSAEL